MSFQSTGFRQARTAAALDITPLVDVIFQLLIFFLLTASFITTPNLGVELPKAAAKLAATQQRDIMVVVTRQGDIEYNGEKVSGEQLLEKLKKEHAQRPDARVLIQADKKAYHGNVVKVMDVAKTLGFRRLGVAIQAPR